MKAPHFFSQYQTLLAEFISFKSISTDPAYNEACRDTALWLEALLQKNGCTTELWQGKKTHPVVYASYTVDKDAPTVLIYGHYDVQPADRADGWSSDPFTLTIKNKRMIARGAVDNKGQIMTHIASVCHAIQNNDLGVNVIFLIEGNEESGNDELPVLLKKHKKKLRADLILVSDGETSDDRPTIDMTFRGGGNIRVVYTTAANAFHSGIYGGAVPSATQSLASMLATLKDTRTNMVAVKNFYTSAITPTRAHKKNHQGLGSPQELAENFGVQKLLCEKGNSFYEQTGLRPTVEISGIGGGYTGAGFQNIVPHRAEARINVRSAPGQDTAQVMDAVVRHIYAHTPAYVDVQVYAEPHGDPIVFEHADKNLSPLVEALEHVYGKNILFKYCGGSIPIFADFQKIFGTDVVSVSLGNEDCNMHGVDENYTLDLAKKGLVWSYEFFKKDGHGSMLHIQRT